MRVIIVCVLACCAAGTLCDASLCDTNTSMPQTVRVKRAKYYSSPPQRFYKRPPMSHPTHGAFSYTPPPSHMMEDEDQGPSHRPYKYSRRPTNEGLGDEDINNLLKYLSKKDLDKIVEHTLAKDKFKKDYDKPLDIPKAVYNEINNDGFEDGNKFSLNGPYIKSNGDYAPTTENPRYNENYSESRPIVVPDTPQGTAGNLNFYAPTPSEGSVSNQQFAVVDGYMQQTINGLGSQSGLNIFTDGKVMQEEQLPMPSNLRHEDQYASFTNNDPAVVKADASSYRVESFGSLPLMNYDSKLHTVSSYHVPHYTVTTSHQDQPAVSQQQSQAPSSTTQVELASSRETKYPDQSDAHLKATKIWTHKSTGTAYYLHKDGTLSLERPRYPKYG